MLLTFARWLLQKAAVALAIVVLALAGYGGWLFLQEEGLLETQRLAKLERAVRERDALRAAQAAVDAKIGAAREALEREKERVRKAGEVVATLRQLESWWDKLFGNREQQAANAEQMKRMEALRGTAVAKLDDLQAAVTRAGWEKEGIDVALQRANEQVAMIEEAQSEVRKFVLAAWDSTKWWIAAALGGYFCGPTLWAVTLYFGVARLLVRGEPIRLGPEPAALPEVGQSHVSVEAVLRAGEVLRIREKFLQASDEGLGKSTRFVLDWRIPFTSVACGLVEMVELRPKAEQAGELRVTLSNGDDPHVELAIVELPAGASLVLRPSFLAGVQQRAGSRLEIRRHWRIFRWQAWITGQFRFFELMGPCRLVVAGSRGVRAERLAEREGAERPARRTNQDATIGFTPNLEYRPVRAETFWSYYRGMNPLFDDLFAGKGVFLVQETATEGSAAKAGKFWSSVWSGVLKVFGL